ncbi:hypothetical protein EDD80_1159 [Anseongella ginsenosidimutans]|uniref:Uncharacterized protein n=1 Tax=Anseongella ginsenosidimutans TaxID=496056 RepID=A0A4R3KP65_9SPHI|nr:hypothetical protein EDD80_1159 [Anseongella ginsenosidimutans]
MVTITCLPWIAFLALHRLYAVSPDMPMQVMKQ